jgi:hypothetical protein
MKYRCALINCKLILGCQFNNHNVTESDCVFNLTNHPINHVDLIHSIIIANAVIRYQNQHHCQHNQRGDPVIKLYRQYTTIHNNQ